MGFFTNYAKYAYKFNAKELEILKAVVSLVEDGLPFPEKPSRLLDKINVCWAPMMIFEGDSTFGMWTYTHFNSIFLCPEETHYTYNRIMQQHFNLQENEKTEMNFLEKKASWADVFLKNDDELDKEKIGFLMYMIEGDGHMTSCSLHELWHRQQCISNPVFYFISCLFSNLFDYEKVCTMPWSIEYDVRQKVDTQSLHKKVDDIYHKLYKYLTELNRSKDPKISEEEKVSIIAEMDTLPDSLKKLLKITKK